MAELAGEANVLLQKAKQALAAGDAQWAAQLCDHLIALDPQARPPKIIKADALEAIAEGILSGIGRNYCLTVAQELRAEASQTPNR